MKLSVVIPAYNEEDNIKQALLDVRKQFPKAQIVVVNDASTDNTLSILMSMKYKGFKNVIVLSNHQNRGHGYSVVRGLKEADGDYILYIDADRQIDLFNFSTMGGFDIISGWRISRNDKPFRKCISFCLKMTNWIRYGYYIKDANCPFKIYKKESLWKLFMEIPNTYIIPIACLEVLARKHKMLVATIPTPHHAYKGERKGFLQSINIQSLFFFVQAFFEIIRL